MKLALVTGTVTATAKDANLVGATLLLTDLIDAQDAVLESAVVAMDTVGAGVGDTVLLVQGSSARMPDMAGSAPVDATIIAVVDTVTRAQN